MPIYTDDPCNDGFAHFGPSLFSSIGIGPKVTKAIDDATKDWLDKHPEAVVAVNDRSLTNAKFMDGSVNSRVIENESITTDDIADLAITTSKIADNAVNAAKIASSAVDGLRTMSTTLPGVAKVGAGLAMNDGALELNGGDIAPAVTAWLNAHPEATTTVEDGAVTTPKLADGAVTDAKLASDGIKKTFPETLAYFIDGNVIELEAETNGYYIDRQGDLSTSENYMITNSFELSAGDKVRIYTKGYLTNIAILSRVNEEGASHPYTPVLYSDGSDIHWYEFTVGISGTHVVCCSTSVEPQLIKSAYSMSSITGQIEQIVDEIGYSVDIVKNVGSYIARWGAMASNPSFYVSDEFDLVKGDVVNIYIRGYLTNVALLAKVNDATASYPYTPILTSPDSVARWYSVTIEHSGTYVISGSNAVDPLVMVSTLHEGDTIPLSDFSVFRKFGVIGDSYASGTLYFGGHYVDAYFRSWGQILARMCGNTCTNYSKGGLTTRTWLTDSHGLSLMNSSDPEDLYILALGINDYSQGTAYLGTIEDITSYESYTDYADSFYGNYGKIIEQVIAHAPHAKLVILTCAATHENAMAYNNAIEEIASHYGLPCIRQYEDPFFQSYTYTHMSGGHPRAVAYSGMAITFKHLIEEAMVEHSNYFDDLYMYTS